MLVSKLCFNNLLEKNPYISIYVLAYRNHSVKCRLNSTDWFFYIQHSFIRQKNTTNKVSILGYFARFNFE